MVSLAAEHSLSVRPASIRRAGWLLIASTVMFVAALLFLFTVGADYYRDLTDAADAVGKSIAGVPEAERARIAGRHEVFFVISVTLFLVPYIVLALGIRNIHDNVRSTDALTDRLARSAWWGSLACLAIWVAVSALELGLLADPDNLPPLARDFNAFGPPLIIVAAIVGAGAVCCAALAVRRARIAPRTALAVVVLVGLVLLATLVESVATGELADVPQFLPLVPALLLGIGLARSQTTARP